MVVLLWALPAAAAGPYDLESRAWDGLSTMARLLQSSGCRAKNIDRIDWAALAVEDSLFVFYPGRELDGTLLSDQIRDGGRVLIADDFGHSDGALGVLGIARHAKLNTDGVELYNDNPQFPVARRQRATQLGLSTEALVSNHPAVLDTPLPATFAFSPNQALVVEGQLGAGSFVAISDPSLLINNMLEEPHNFAFAKQLAAQMCAPGHNIWVLGGSFTEVRPSSPIRRGMNHVPVRFNEMLQKWNEWLNDIEQVGLLTFALTLMGAAIVLLVWFFPSERIIDGHWTRLQRREAPVDEATLLSLLRVEFLERLRKLIAHPARASSEAIARVLEQKAGADAARLGGRLAESLRKSRWRPSGDGGDLVPDSRVSRAELERMVNDAELLFVLLEGRE
jgi:hypothetical protein